MDKQLNQTEILQELGEVVLSASKHNSSIITESNNLIDLVGQIQSHQHQRVSSPFQQSSNYQRSSGTQDLLLKRFVDKNMDLLRSKQPTAQSHQRDQTQSSMSNDLIKKIEELQRTNVIRIHQQ
ncbi:UNKNOWN [Stylonychia lemnae]|uniref:Uncharacterized protein n=1 Tax=Stylonychia lemnae TaxID=5949 RepID=A0A078ATZ6_STYLE|nr:UNKNOWN [Stylonychia lemnae]|eukprot:CDW85729.1 UNKNOWN [Stylonychia lemnae]